MCAERESRSEWSSVVLKKERCGEDQDVDSRG